MKNNVPVRTGTEPYRGVAVGDTCISGQGIATIVARDKRHRCDREHRLYPKQPTDKLPQSDEGIR